MADSPDYQRARARVRALRGFYVHLTVYLLVNLGLFLLDLLTPPAGLIWFYWPLLGWGIGLAVHAVIVFGLGGWLGRDWEERKIRELIEKDKGR
jgi:hypothetical protein